MQFRYPDKPIETTPEFFKPDADHSHWIAQRKYDGWRMEVFVDGQLRCLSRSNKTIRDAFRGTIPSNFEQIIESMNLPDGTVLDTEFVGFRGGLEWSVWIFDCLAWGGKWLSATPYQDRWDICQSLAGQLPECGLIRLAETIYPKTGQDIINEFEQLKAEWIANGKGKEFLYEGIVAKRRTGKMRLSRNECVKSPDMFKLLFRKIDEKRY